MAPDELREARENFLLALRDVDLGAVAAFLAAIPAGVLTAILLIAVINRRAFGWQIDLHVTVQQFVNAFAVAMIAALAAGLYPAWRTARAPLASDIREE